MGDLLLARIPEEIVAQRDAHYKAKTDQQTQAWEDDPLREQHPSMPLNVDRQSRVSFGGGNKKSSS